MRRNLGTIAILSATLGFATTAGAAYERVERSVILDEALPGAMPVEFENLIGSITLKGGGNPGRVKVEAQVIAEGETAEQAQALADSIRLDRTNADGGAVIHVAYPVDEYTAFKMPREETDNPISRWVGPLLKKFNKSTVATVYDGHAVELGQSKGAMGLAVHLTITVPHDVHASMRQFMGSVECDLLRGDLDIENVEGQVDLGRLYGTLNARTGGGDLSILSFKGDHAAMQSASGTLEVVDVTAGKLDLKTTSGAIQGHTIRSEDMNIEADSGGIALAGVDTRRISVSTGSGDVDLGTLLQRTREASIRSLSGDVILRLGPIAPFDLAARSESGTVKAESTSFAVEQKEKAEATVRRGTGGADIEVTTDSGSVVLKTR